MEPVTPARLAPARTRAAALVAATWLVAALPLMCAVLGVTSCPVARFLHEPCPGCGMTRAIELLARGDVAGSLAMHPLAVPTLLVQGVFAILTVIITWRR